MILLYWKQIVVGLLAVGLFYAGWHTAMLTCTAAKAEHTQKVADSIPKVVTKTQTITKVVHDSQDTCAATAMPAAVLNELRSGVK